MSLIPLPLLVSALRYSIKQQTTTWRRLAWGIAAGYLISSALLMVGRFSLEYFVAFPELFAAHRPPLHVIGFMRGYLDSQGSLLPGQRIVIAGFVITLAVYFFLGFAHYFRLKLFGNVPSLAYVLLLATLACWTLSGLSFLSGPLPCSRFARRLLVSFRNRPNLQIGSLLSPIRRFP